MRLNADDVHWLGHALPGLLGKIVDSSASARIMQLRTFEGVAYALWTEHQKLVSLNKLTLFESRRAILDFETYIVNNKL